MSRTTLLLAIALIGSLRAQSLTDLQVMSILRSASENCAGAAQSVKEEIWANVKKSTYEKRVSIPSALVTTLDADPGPSGNANWFGRYISGGECSGAIEGPATLMTIFPQGNPSEQAIYEASRDSFMNNRAALEREAEHFGIKLHVAGPFIDRDGSTYRWSFGPLVDFEKALPNGSIRLSLLTTESDLKNLRKNQKVSIEMKLTGLSSTSEGTAFYGIIEQILTEGKMLKCANGHQYAPSAGFKFCPIDGLPLQ